MRAGRFAGAAGARWLGTGSRALASMPVGARSRLWLAPIALWAIATCIYYLPSLGPTGRACTYVAFEAGALIAVVLGIVINRPARPGAWVLIAAGMVFVVAGDAAWYWISLVQHGPASPSIADIFYLAEYPVLFAGAVGLVRGRPNRAMFVNAVLVTVSTTVVIWELAVRPAVGAAGGADAATIVAALYPVADIALLGVVIGITFSTGLPSASLRLLSAGIIVASATDFVDLRLGLAGPLPDPSLLDAGWLLAMALWAAASLHGSAREVRAVDPVESRRRVAGNVLLLAGAFALVPLTLLALVALGEDLDLPVLATAWIVLVVLAAIRLTDLVADLRSSDERFQAIVEGSPIGIGIVRGGELILTNAAARRMVSSDIEDDLRGRPLTDFVTTSARAELRARLDRIASTGSDESPFETVGMRRDGSEFPVVVHARSITLRDGPATALFVYDVSDERAAEATLSASEHRYRELFVGNPQPMWVYDLETLRFLAVNNMAVTRYGWSREEFLAMTIADIRPPEDVPALRANVATDTEAIQTSGPWRHRRRDGTILEVEITSHAITWDGRAARLVLAFDMTQRRSLEEQLRQAQKMEAVGRLAGGVAHDFNNLLTVIAGYADVLRGDLAPGDARIEDVEEILRASDRAAGLTHQLLAFSRRQVLKPQVLDLNASVRDVQSMLTRLIGEDVELRSSLADDLSPILADPIQITQVLLNLAANARDAMADGGTLTITTANAVLDETYVQAHPDARQGPHAVLAVTDSGGGMDADTVAHLFEPFFTTKEVGQGTGLGLATVYGIVRQSGGTIWVYSEPGHGTTFKLYFPAAPAGEGRRAAGGGAPRATHAGTETVLVAEDEEAVRTLVTLLLQRSGYHVLAAASADAAESIAAAYQGPIDLLTSDVIMPGHNGAALAVRVGALRPGMPTLFMSGYAGGAIVRRGVIDAGASFIEKPFALDALLAKVREVLDAPADSRVDPAARPTAGGTEDPAAGPAARPTTEPAAGPTAGGTEDPAAGPAAMTRPATDRRRQDAVAGR